MWETLAELGINQSFANGWLTGFASGIIVNSNLIFPIVGGVALGTFFGDNIKVLITNLSGHTL